MGLSDQSKAYIGLHIAILFFGVTAILGDLIDLPSLSLVWWRLLISLLAFIPVIFFLRLLKLEAVWSVKEDIFKVGLFLVIHWITFFASVKLANASVGVLCLATTSLMTAVVEPFVMRRPFRLIEFIFGLCVIPGMVLVVHSVSSDMALGFVLGLFSALFSALFTTYNKKIVDKGSTILFTFAELLVAFILLSIMVLGLTLSGKSLEFMPPRPIDWGYLLFLSIVCTTICYTIAFRSLRHMSAFSANLSINLEPVYGILLAWWILKDNEEMGNSFYYGAGLILLVVFLFPILEKYFLRIKLIKPDAGTFH